MGAGFRNPGGHGGPAMQASTRPDSTIPRYAATAAGFMGMYNVTFSPRFKPSSSSPLATRALSRFSPAYVIFPSESDPSSPKRIAVLFAPARRQLSAMFIRAPGSHSG